jgi:chromosome segregation ATPase
MNPDEFVLQVLKDKLTEINGKLNDTENWRLQLQDELEQCRDDFNTFTDNKNDVLEKLKLIDPEGVYE